MVEFLGDLENRLIQSETGLYADDQEIESVGHPAPDFFLTTVGDTLYVPNSKKPAAAAARTVMIFLSGSISTPVMYTVARIG